MKTNLTSLVGWYDLFNSTFNTNRQYPGLGTVKKIQDKKILKFWDIFHDIKTTQIHWKSVITVICQYKYKIPKFNWTCWPLPYVPHIQLVTYRCSPKIHGNCKKLGTYRKFLNISQHLKFQEFQTTPKAWIYCAIGVWNLLCRVMVKKTQQNNENAQ